MPERRIKAVFFDFMGTCLDWHSTVVQSFPSKFPATERSKLALEWRRRYFEDNAARNSQGLPPEDIDITLSRVLDKVIAAEFSEFGPFFDAPVKQRMIAAWHQQKAWPEVQKAISTVRHDLGLDTFVHANGTTRLQLDLTRSSGLDFNMLFSSQLLGVYKPNPVAYQKALELVKLRPEEVVLVAAHAYDLRGAKACGMSTIYIHRWTDDIDEDLAKVEQEVDCFLEGMADLPNAIQSLG